MNVSEVDCAVQLQYKYGVYKHKSEPSDNFNQSNFKKGKAGASALMKTFMIKAVKVCQHMIFFGWLDILQIQPPECYLELFSG